MNFLHVSAREWFDKANGNTYSSVAVFLNGARVGVVPMVYGHGHLTHLDLARIVLRGAGFETVESYYSENWRRAGWAVSQDSCCVTRKRDLHQGGKTYGDGAFNVFVTADMLEGAGVDL